MGIMLIIRQYYKDAVVRVIQVIPILQILVVITLIRTVRLESIVKTGEN